jgi:hypothetical protein
MKSAAISFGIVTGLLGVVPHPLRGADAPTPASRSTASIIVTNKSTEASARMPYLSAGLPEIVKMHKAGVDASVLLAFVQNSPVAYHPSAKEVIYLRDQGLSSEIISALLRRGGELRDRAAEAARQERSRSAPAPAPAPMAPPAPASPAPPQAAASTPVVVYANPTYPVYTTPAYVTSASYSYPWPAYYGNPYCGPSYSCYRPAYYSYRAGCYPYAYGGHRSSWYPSFYAGYRSGCYSGWGFGVGYAGGRYYGHGGGHDYGHGGGYRFAGGWRGGGAYCRR